ncbi:uncharacterized protein FIBRA_03513 [Fibroporia radiculosa]|uniref:EF-hand domain-containing protein n=1 Tax=Fibroporia radiculosa TaxID=599839 RepID=J4GNI7_9APHY|nr:uncharacterized protein FIBRA_03513 [Fibroporia radiculosa]CCM01460.1 predicted protein [Fibroporia radiculosa]
MSLGGRNDFSSSSRPISPAVQFDSDPNTPSHPLLPGQYHKGYWQHAGKQSKADELGSEPRSRDYAAHDQEPAPAYPGTHRRNETADYHPANNRSSWDLLGGIRRLEHSYVEFDPRRASEAHLVFAEGDLPKNAVSLGVFIACYVDPRTHMQPRKFSRVYNYLINVSIVTRWTLFIVPFLGLLWIPGILGLTSYKNSTIWGVKLIWWSIWLTVVWCGWWGALAATMLLPSVARNTIGVVAVGMRRYIEWLGPLRRYIALFVWTLVVWISFQPLINTRREPNISSGSGTALSTAARIFFALFECAIILLGEKVAIQYIAAKFHERSYAERVADQKFAVRILVNLYRHSSDMPWRSDTLRDGQVDAHAPKKPKKLLKKALQGVKFAATTTTTALGNVASEIAGSSVLQPNSPQAVVKTALESANKSRLASAHSLMVNDIMPFFPTPEDADAAFALFDKDMNGDATRDEVEIACMECHREQLSIEHSMRDLDSAVGRLDNILMTIYVFAAILILAVALEAQLLTLVTSAGTFVLGLSWLIGTSLGEVLTSIIFLFVKHPYDVGDRVSIDSLDYTVKEIRLLSTIFIDSSNCSVQAPHSLLNTKFIQNYRRSPVMSEAFKFDVAFSTTFEQLEQLRELMIAFLKSERRDFLPNFDVTIVGECPRPRQSYLDLILLCTDIPAQEKMTLHSDIKYKSNWQQSALKSTRRNKWISALKSAMDKAKIFGPKGNPNAIPSAERVTLVPWEQVEAEDKKKLAKAEVEEARHQHSGSLQELRAPSAHWNLTDKEAIILDDTQDVFGDANSVASISPTPSRPGSTEPRRRQRTAMPAAVSMPSPLIHQSGEEIEMTQSSSQRHSPSS